MLKILRSFISLKYSLFSFLFLGSYLFLLLSLPFKSPGWDLFFIKNICYGIPALFFIRAFGMMINQIIDYSWDKQNPRTCYRILPAKLLSMSQALLYSLCSLVLFLFLVRCISYRCFIKGCFASVCIFIYPYVKRFHMCCHFVLGLIYFFAIITVGEALLGKVDVCCIIYASSIALFIAANDIIYGILDIDFDTQKGLFSFPAILGEKRSLQTVYVCYGISLLLLFLVGICAYFPWMYYLLVICFALILLMLCRKLRATLIFAAPRFFSWEQAFFFSNIVISLSLFSLFVVLFIFQCG